MKPQKPEDLQALIICGLLSVESDLLKNIEPELQEVFGKVALRSEPVPFEWTDYYNTEMGNGILRKWLLFSAPLNLVESWKYKLITCEIEDRYRINGKRRINIDPGFIRLDGLWLLTTKSAGHRAYLDKGIWIELTLRFLREHCEELPWTYPDHRPAQIQAFFMKTRNLLKKSLNSL